MAERCYYCGADAAVTVNKNRDARKEFGRHHCRDCFSFTQHIGTFLETAPGRVFVQRSLNKTRKLDEVELTLKRASWRTLFKVIRDRTSRFESRGNFWASVQHLEAQFDMWFDKD
jgi:hypothetical protein